MPHTGLVIVLVASVLAPLASMATRRIVPGAVFEIILGILIGPAVLALAAPTGFVNGLSELGIAMLMFLAGTEVDLRLMRGRTLRLAGTSWGASVLIAGIIAAILALAGHGSAALYLVIPLTTTALGTLLPILLDTGVMGTRVGSNVMAIGTLGEFGPIVLIALVLGGGDPWVVLGFLAVFFAVVLCGFWLVRRARLTRLRQAVASGLHSANQLPIRASMLAVAFLAVLADDFGLDALLGAFCAGLLVRAAAHMDTSSADVTVFREKLEAVGFGLLVPVFFVVSGMKMDIRSMLAEPLSLVVVPLMVILLLVVRGIPTYWFYRREVGPSGARSLAAFAATALPLVVVVTQMGVENGAIKPSVAAAMVVGGLLSVLVLPAIGLRRMRPRHSEGRVEGMAQPARGADEARPAEPAAADAAGVPPSGTDEAAPA